MSREVDDMMGAVGDEVYMPVASETMALAAIIEAMRAQTKMTERQMAKLDTLNSTVAKVREDIAIMKVRDEQMKVMSTLIGDTMSRLTAVELRNAQQDGAGKLVQWIKDVGPWILGAGAALLAAAGKIHIG